MDYSIYDDLARPEKPEARFAFPTGFFSLGSIIMPILANARHERFAQELAKGRPASEAFVSAGYSRNDSNASRLNGNEQVRARVRELQSRAVEGVVITRQRILEELSTIAFAELGHQHVKSSDKRAAAVDIARIEGWIIERRETGAPGEFDGMTADELRASIAERVGLDDASHRQARRSGEPRVLRSKPH